MQVVETPIASIRPYSKNAKKHPEDQIRAIADSIREFGFNQPIVIDKRGVIIVGHGRYAAACLLGLQEVPVLEIEIPEEKANAYRLADNKLNESDWDMQLVIEELKTLTLEDLDLTGFNRRLILDPHANDDVVPPTPAAPKSVLGDLYEFGAHRLLCGDSRDENSMRKLMGESKADMIFTDPPYNVNYKGRGQNTGEGIMNDWMDGEKFQEFLNGAFKAMRTAIKGGGQPLHIPFELDPEDIRRRDDRGGHRDQEPAHLEQAHRIHGMGRLPLEARAILLCLRRGRIARFLRRPHALHDRRLPEKRIGSFGMGEKAEGDRERRQNVDLDHEARPGERIRPPDAKTDRTDRIRHREQLQGGRHRPRSVRGERKHDHRLRKAPPCSPGHRAGSEVRRRHSDTLVRLYGEPRDQTEWGDYQLVT